ncbi:SusC/RagA family TonB-linked outer membrane protein [Flavisolibacter ginsenosidimutans]|uniref:SusC/RagA family TonB-linked outer membrane protein n=1 Tax=Flavisolibacter ginsenosidimutans TaxID=661481 RepID=A0A5B8UHI4_9BACT|nr:SusC/RagA family TonB-linked outer membrane protein [Flavisolibacter ginsenosidimutans]QEC55589.1 SusC/RagA family TonB-linked outer membrane protein [Flavisolibacter ginsenosidimutans]
MRRLLRFIFLALSLLLTGYFAQAQDRNITGHLTSTDNAPIAGATVTVKGTQRSTTTDANGNFKISAKKGDVLLFTYVGMQGKEATVGNGNTLSLQLSSGENALGEVVVTALGIKKEQKALGYSVTQLSAQELMKNKNTNIVNSLAGKVPGVNVTQFSGSAGAGASITIRGGNSTSETRQNQPLFVIDGIIYDNSTSVTGNTGTDGLSRSNTTYSNRIMDINPEDIESLSVLKGSAAAALYGSRAADGVVIITTKKGAEGAVTVNVNSKVSTSWANKLPEVQTTFGPGFYSSNGVLNTNNEYRSWGPKIPADSTIYDNIGSFFRHGTIYDNNVNVSGGSKNGSFYLSGSNFRQTGIVPGTGYEKTTFRFNGEQKYGRLTLNSNAAYSIANTDRTLTTAGLYGSGVGSMQSLYTFPQVFNLKNYLNPDGTQHRVYAGTLALEGDIDNPYWIINQDSLTSKTNRFTGGINANFKITSWWDITGRLGYDQYTTNDYTFIAPGSAVSPLYQNGRLSKDMVNYTYITTTAMTNFHKTFSDFDTHLMLGTTTENFNTATQNHWGYGFSTPGTYSLNSIANTNKFFTDATTPKRLVGVYGEVGVSYKDLVYLTGTGRNDWSSTLIPAPTNSYFYPSLSGSFVFSQLIPRNSILSFGKLRASWARVGKDANPFVTATYVNPPININGYVGLGNQYYAGNPLLIPEIQTSWEVGGEMRFLNGRIGLDYTYYHSETQNQIGQPRLAQSGGFIFSTLNSGSVINKGMEIALTGKAISQRNFGWDVTLNFSYNQGRLGAFIPGVQYFYPTDAQFGTVKAASIPNGGFFLGMTGQSYLREKDAKGTEIPNGRYLVDPTTGFYKLNTTNPVVGNREPEFIGGVNSTIRYKKLILAFLLDVRKGGDVFNGTEYALVANGLSKRTLLNDRQSVTVSGINSVTGADFTQTYNANQSYTLGTSTVSGYDMIQRYWSNYAANSYNFITSVNWLKLRSLSLTYDFSDLLKNQKIIKGISATAVGTNLLTWTNYKGMDPEVSAAGGTGGSGSTGIDYLGVPAVSSFTFGLNLKF